MKLTVFLFLIFSYWHISAQSQWTFVRDELIIQPYVFNVRSLNNKIYFQGTSILRQGLHQYAGFHLTKMDNFGNIIEDTVLGNISETYIQLTNILVKKKGSLSVHLVGKRNQLFNGNATLGYYGLVIDSTYKQTVIPAFQNYVYHEYLTPTHFHVLDNNKYLSIATLSYDNTIYNEHTHLRIVDSLGNVLKEKVFNIPNRRLHFWTHHEYDGYYYLPSTRNQDHPNPSP